MKRFYSIIVAALAVALVAALAVGFAACTDDNPEVEGYTMVVPDGAPALAADDLIDEIDKNGAFAKLGKVEIVQSSAIATRSLEADFAVVPANLAANLYNKGQDIKLLATVTRGNLYVLGVNSEVKELSDLVGKRVFSIGQGSVPDYIFQTLLKNEGIVYEQGDEAVAGKVVITYVEDGSGVMSQLAAANKSGKEAIGVIAEPAASKAFANAGAVELFDLQQLWKDYTGSETLGYPQAVLIGKASVVENDPAFVSLLIDKMAENGTFITENSDKVSDILVKAYPSTTLNTAFSKETLERCNCKLIKIADAKDDYVSMLEAIAAINAQAIGGKLPDEGLYYTAE